MGDLKRKQDFYSVECGDTAHKENLKQYSKTDLTVEPDISIAFSSNRSIFFDGQSGKNGTDAYT